MNRKYKAVFCDIDGTLVDDNKYMSEETKSIIKKLVENGIYFVLTSGKPFKLIKNFSNQCNALPYVIGSNGAIAYDYSTNTTIYERGIDKQIVLKTVHIIKEQNIYVSATVSGNTVFEEARYGFHPKNREDVLIVDSIKDYILNTKEPILKIAMFDENKEKLSTLRNKILDKFDLNITPIDIFVVPERFKEIEDKGKSNPLFSDAMNKEVSKAEAIKVLIEKLNISLDEIVAVGDGTNDYDMLKVAGFKIAMSNGTKELKDIADMVTLSNNESGVAVALKKIFEIGI